MLHLFQETKFDCMIVFLLLQPTQMKFKQQQKITQFRYESSTKEK